MIRIFVLILSFLINVSLAQNDSMTPIDNPLCCNQKTFPNNKIRQKKEFYQIIDDIKIIDIPLKVNYDLFKNIDTSNYFSDTEFKVMQLEKLKMPYGDHYKEIPILRLPLSKQYHSIILLQYYESESFAWLINYSLNGIFLDSKKLYYDNAEGNLWMNTEIIKSDLIIISEGNIYKNDGKEILDTVNINQNGIIK